MFGAKFNHFSRQLHCLLTFFSGRMETDIGEIKLIESRRFEYGLFWTHEMNEEFIRIRKESEERFAGKRSGSFPLKGWTYVLQQMGLENKLTAQQAKKRWENFVKKYKDEKDPLRVGKNADEPIKWPLYYIMDWAVGARLEKIKPPQPFVPTEDSNSEAAAINSVLQESETQQPLDATNQSGIAIVMVEPSQESLPEDVNPELPPVTDTVEERGELRRSRKRKGSPTPSMAASATTSGLSARQQAAAILDAADSRHQESLQDIKSCLDQLVKLQRGQSESARIQAEASQRTAAAVETLAAAAERQAATLERFALLVEERLPKSNVNAGPLEQKGAVKPK